MVKHKLPTLEEISQLPRWAKVAFAARCIRRLEPFALISDLDARHKEAVSKVIAFVEYAARNGKLENTDSESNESGDAKALAVIVNDAYWAAEAKGDPLQFAARAAHAALNAAIAASDLVDEAVDSWAALAVATAAKPEKADLVCQFRNDFERCTELASDQNWPNDSGISPEKLGPL